MTGLESSGSRQCPRRHAKGVQHPGPGHERPPRFRSRSGRDKPSRQTALCTFDCRIFFRKTAAHFSGNALTITCNFRRARTNKVRMNHSRRAVFVCCDGLGRRWVTPTLTPVLSEIAKQSLWCADHRAIFPSATRASAASVATGCRPARHGLHGNRMGLIQDGRITVRDVGKPDFRTHMRAATGGTLRVPTLAERVAEKGGFVAFSNVSPGAAYFLDPESFGFVYHRAGSYAPGGDLIAGRDALNVTHDLAGDWAMTERFCFEVVRERKPRVSVLWLANPDLTLHGAPLGSPQHRDALRATERCVTAVIETVARLRAAGENILLLIGSDHGQETVGDYVTIETWLEARGLGGELANGRIAVATQGTAALLYATNGGRAALLDVLAAMRAEPWAGEVVVADRLAALGRAPSVGWGGGGRQHGAARRCERLWRRGRSLGGGRAGQSQARRIRPAWRLGSG